MKIGILAPEIDWHVEEVRRELRKRGTLSPVFSPTSFFSGIDERGFFTESSGRRIEELDVLFIRRVPGGSLEQVVFRMDVLHSLEERGVICVNKADSIELAVDKYYTTTALARAGIPVPRTMVAETFSDAMRAFRALGGDVVIKPLFGSFGMGILRVNDEDLAFRVFKTLLATRGVYYVQEYLPHGGRDVRVFTLGGRAIAGMYRISEVDWRTNIARGARPLPCKLEGDVKELSEKVSDVLEMDYAGVDLILTEDRGPFVVEVNSAPAWRGLQEVSERKIASEIAEYLIKKAKRG